MSSTRRRWTWAAGVLLGASSAGMCIAQDSTLRPAVPPVPTNSSSLPGKADRATSASPYFPMVRETVPQDSGRPTTTALVNTPQAVPTRPAAVAQAALPAESQSSGCSGPSGNCPGNAGAKPSVWVRMRHCLQHGFLGYREEFEAPPLGYYLYLHGQTEVANGDAARMVLYHYDFVEGSDQLKARGKYQLAKIAALLPRIFNPIIIEVTPDAPGLDESRRVAVVRELASGPFPVPSERVVIGRPIAVGLPGGEAVLLYRNQLLNTESGGLRATAGGGRAGGGGGAIGTTSSGVLTPIASAGPSGP